MPRDCGTMHCTGQMEKTRNLEGEVTWLCPKCGREEDASGARKA